METSTEAPTRTMLAVYPETRDKVNLVKAQLGFEKGGSYTTDDAVSFLCDFYWRSREQANGHE